MSDEKKKNRLALGFGSGSLFDLKEEEVDEAKKQEDVDGVVCSFVIL